MNLNNNEFGYIPLRIPYTVKRRYSGLEKTSYFHPLPSKFVIAYIIVSEWGLKVLSLGVRFSLGAVSYV